MLFNSPMSLERADRLIELLEVSRGATVLDAGCGRGEFLIRVLESSGTTGVGVDLDTASIAAARARASGQLSAHACEFREGDMRQMAFDPGSFDLTICLGSTHAFGAGDAAYPNTLASLARLVRPGGYLLIGEGYWRQEPASAYLEFIGDPVGVYRSHLENISLAESEGIIPFHASVSTEEEWDDFEWSHIRSVERKAAQQPNDPAWITRRNRSREWRDAYLRWGRSTMGFGFYLFAKPETARNDPAIGTESAEQSIR